MLPLVFLLSNNKASFSLATPPCTSPPGGVIPPPSFIMGRRGYKRHKEENPLVEFIRIEEVSPEKLAIQPEAPSKVLADELIEIIRREGGDELADLASLLAYSGADRTSLSPKERRQLKKIRQIIEPYL